MGRAEPRQLTLLFGRTALPLSSRHEFLLEGVAVSYRVKRSARRRGITLIVDEEGLRIAAPLRASVRRIESVLESNASWIRRKLAQWRERRPAKFEWRAGARIAVLGETLTIACDPAHSTVRREADLLIAPAGALDGAAALKAAVMTWLRETALACFAQRCACYARALAVTVPTIRLSNARTRWGSCHPDGRILLNWRLIHMPLTLIDYVVVHELAHLLHPHHGPRFWQAVEAVLPDYAARRHALRRDGHRYLAV